MKKLAPILALALAACEQQPDGYTFDGGEFERPRQSVNVVEYDSVLELRRAAPAEAKTEGRDLYAFALIYPDRCEIHVAPLSSSESRMWLGHEMTHCVYGRWHD